MNTIHPVENPEIKMKIKEAETCHSMGMVREALQVYEKILTGLPGKDGQLREIVGGKISILKKEIVDQEQAEKQGVTEEDLSILKKTLAVHDDVPTILDSAAALKELGLVDEAIAEFEKLLQFDFSKSEYSKLDCSPAKIIFDYLNCQLEVKQPQEVVKEAYKVIYKNNLSEK